MPRILTLAFALCLSGCSGGGSGGAPDVTSPLPQSQDALLAGESLALAYTGYPAGQHPDRGDGEIAPSREQIVEDLQILADHGFRPVRLYDAGATSTQFLEVIREHRLAFDDHWKGDPNSPGGAEKHRGLFTVDRTPKATMGGRHPAGEWELVWQDEFNGPAGTPPDPANWSHEIGDGSLYGNPGWGNEELQYYTDDPANAAADGKGNLLITVREADGSLDCYYGPCLYTSARLVTRDKVEVEYGRIEARVLLPAGSGVWSAFWSLGTDLAEVGWPETGEIDIMEFVGRKPNTVFGTLHGPGHAGNESYGDVREFDKPLFGDYHVFRVDWWPNRVEWYVDDVLYHTATPFDLPGEWVYNDPVFLLLNVAMGGNFGGDVKPGLSLPLSMAVDYVRVYRQLPQAGG